MFNLTPWKQQNALASTQQPINRIRAEFDSLFDRFFGDGDWNLSWGMDLQDRDQALAIRLEAPGFEAENFDVQVTGNMLTVRAERKEESGEKDEQSCSRRRLQRSVTLPVGVQADKVEARYHNGILEVVLPKSPEAQGHRIEVKKA